MNISEQKKQRLLQQMEEQQKSIAYDVKEFTIEYYVNKYLKNEETDENDLYIPDYQREFIWDIKHQSRFIESLFLGLPVPFLFSAEIKETGRMEIVDGSQRIRTMAAFINDELTLNYLEKLSELNNCKYSDLPRSVQRQFENIAIRMIVLSSKATEDVRNEMFDRINTSSVPLLPMETRRGIYKGLFTDFIAQLANEPKFKALCPLAKYMQNRREEEELLLRFFAFRDLFPNFSKVDNMGVASFLDEYLEKMNKDFNKYKKEELTKKYNALINYIEKAYPNQGFAKSKGGIGISKPYFEAIAVGVSLALDENPNLIPVAHDELVINKHSRNQFFNILEGRYHTHTAQKIESRIKYVKTICLK